MQQFSNNEIKVNKYPHVQNNHESISSASSCHSDLSDDVRFLSRRASSHEIPCTVNNQASEYKRFRSMSDGSAIQKAQKEDPFEVFPCLPECVLEKMGLRGDGPRERIGEEELEQKFTRLALAFTIDSATIKDRYERQRRYRDQTESNLLTELERLVEKVHRIHPLCIDFETTELVSALLAQVDIVMKASSLLSISAERYGAVQLEERLTESVNLMISHVELLKQQRDYARKHLQYTKRVLQQETHSNTPPPPSNLSINKVKTLGRRRASIATFSQANDDGAKIEKKSMSMFRRTSDMSLRASSLNRNSRPTRLDLGVELNKIKEGIIDNEEMQQELLESDDNDSNPDSRSVAEISCNGRGSLKSGKKLSRIDRIRTKVAQTYVEWSENGTLHEICCFCALMCFSISIIIMVNIVIEYEFSKRGIQTTTPIFFWFWMDENNNEQIT